MGVQCTPDFADIQIKIFDDRITIFSPGRLYGGLTLDDLKTDTYQSRTRNKLIAEAFYLTNKIEKYGSGYIRIRKELEWYPEIILTVEENSGGLLVTFKQGEGINEGINEGITQLLGLITAYCGINIPDISERLNVPPKTLERWLKQLKDKKIIEHRGSRRTGGYYIIEGE